MSELRIRLLGHVQVLHGDRPPAQMLRKAQELLALVLLAPQRLVRREGAVNALWPYAESTASRKAMRQALWQIHLATDAAARDVPRLVLTDAETVRINPERPVWLDVEELAAAAQAAQTCPADALTEESFGRLAGACDLYRGPLLDGCDDEWCLVERTHFEDLQLTLLDRLSAVAEQRGRRAAAIHLAERLLEIEPAHERSHRRLMWLFYQSDDRTRALRQYQRCRSVLERELNVRPSGRTEELAAAIGAGASAGDGDPVRSDEGWAAIVDPGWSARLLDGFRAELAALRASVDAINDHLRDVGARND